MTLKILVHIMITYSFSNLHNFSSFNPYYPYDLQQLTPPLKIWYKIIPPKHPFLQRTAFCPPFFMLLYEMKIGIEKLYQDC